MIDMMERVAASLCISLLFCLATAKFVGILQQSGYKNKSFWAWLKRKDNLFFNRLSVLSLCLALSTAIVALCFSFLKQPWGVLLSALPFVGLLVIFCVADRKYALKVKAVRTPRTMRLFGVYYALTAMFSYILIALLAFLKAWNGSKLYATVAYVPVAVLPLLLPAFVALANGITGIFEKAHNEKYIKRAGQVLDETQITRIAVVGSYGKTTIKNILKTLLSEKYSVVETPASYNTPMGIAKTVFSDEFQEKEILIAEMGARKAGDISELCKLVRPDYAIFTGVCAQHIASFGSLEEVLKEKSQIFKSGAKTVVCGESLQSQITADNAVFVNSKQIRNLTLGKTTRFTLLLSGEEIAVETPLLGRTAAEDILLAATLCKELGLSVEEIAAGLAKLVPVPHRLQLMESGGAYILDDGYNCNIEGAKGALEVLKAFDGKTCIVTPGIVEGGVLEEELNQKLGEEIAKQDLDKVILVGDTLVGAVKTGYLQAGGDGSKLVVTHTLTAASELVGEWLEKGDCVLFLNDLPDAY